MLCKWWNTGVCPSELETAEQRPTEHNLTYVIMCHSVDNRRKCNLRVFNYFTSARFFNIHWGYSKTFHTQTTRYNTSKCNTVQYSQSACLHTRIHTYIHTYIHIYIHIHIHTYIHIHKYKHTYIHTHVRTYVLSYVRTYVHYIHTYNFVRHVNSGKREHCRLYDIL
jgi:hypothetical protein